ncbi:acyltransferase family protein [Microlunatus spumicola]|uniref:Acyltransferase family protein n=1 Tax=Microlunatus spumicola TaxID=81499 RepID=A0ABP6WPX7_9ACTN
MANHVWGWPAGGFVGVDVFFVISGFLITGLLLREHDRTGHISFSGFYRRRVKRIMPASVLVLVVTVASSWFVFNAARWQTTVVDGVWSLLFVGNWRFALQSTDYFASDRPVSPLQHYWSLGVEEQFYLVWPWLMLLVLVLLGRRAASTVRPRLVLGVLITVLSVASFVWALHDTQVAANRAYFSTFSRVWELGAGALLAVAVPLVSRLPDRLRPPLAWVGLAGMVAGVFVVSPNGFDAPASALPVLATALVIAAGTGVRQQRLLFPLTNRAAGYVGDISFSLYLWHFPVVVLGHAVLGDGLLPGLFLVALATILAVYTYHLVEDPVRRSQWLVPRSDRGRSRRRGHRRHRRSTQARPAFFSPAYQKTAVSLLALVTAVLLVVALQPRTATTTATVAPPVGLPSGASAGTTAQDQLQASLAQALGAEAWPTLSPSMSSVLTGGLGPDDIHACGGADTIDESSCTWGDPKADRTIVVVGNSTALVYVDLLRRVIGNDDGWRVISYGMYGCGFRDMTILAPPPDAQKSCRQRPDDAVAAINRLDPDVLVLSGTGNVESATSEIGKITVKPKLVFLPGPPADKDVNDCFTKVSTPADCVSVPEEGWGVLESKLANDLGGVYVNSQKWFCVDLRCPAFVGTTPMKLDRFHLTTEYNGLIAPAVKEELESREIVRLSA